MTKEWRKLAKVAKVYSGSKVYKTKEEKSAVRDYDYKDGTLTIYYNGSLKGYDYPCSQEKFEEFEKSPHKGHWLRQTFN